jgi:hypothetical protein
MIPHLWPVTKLHRLDLLWFRTIHMDRNTVLFTCHFASSTYERVAFEVRECASLIKLEDLPDDERCSYVVKGSSHSYYIYSRI